MTRIVFLDTETTGLALDDDIWEFAAILRDGGEDRAHHMFIQHDAARCGRLPEPFLSDHRARFPMSYGTGWHSDVKSREAAAREIAGLFTVPEGGNRPHVVGAVPNFDTERIALLLRRSGLEPGWHYHLIDVENLAAGFLAGSFTACQEAGNPEADGPSLEEAKQAIPPWDSEQLSRAVGVDPDDFERHSALGDAMWARAIYDAVMGGSGG